MKGKRYALAGVILALLFAGCVNEPSQSEIDHACAHHGGSVKTTHSGTTDIVYTEHCRDGITVTVKPKDAEEEEAAEAKPHKLHPVASP